MKKAMTDNVQSEREAFEAWWVTLPKRDKQIAFTAWQARAAIHPEVQVRPEIEQLMKFYDVTTVEAVIEAQNRHVERLQRKLRELETLNQQFRPNRVREG